MIHARSKRVALRTTPRWGIATLLCAAIGISCATGPRYSEFSPTISADDRMMIFQSDREKRHRFRLYYKQKIDGRWREPVFMEGLGAVEGDGGPFITYDQNYLVFSSLRKGGAGNLDLWISQRLGTTWGPPVNMGAPINSSGYDGFGTISPDGKTIAYSACANDGYQIYKMSVEGDEYIKLTESLSGFVEHYLCPVWSSDGQRIYYVENGLIILGVVFSIIY